MSWNFLWINAKCRLQFQALCRYLDLLRGCEHWVEADPCCRQSLLWSRSPRSQSVRGLSSGTRDHAALGWVLLSTTQWVTRGDGQQHRAPHPPLRPGGVQWWVLPWPGPGDTAGNGRAANKNIVKKPSKCWVVIAQNDTLETVWAVLLYIYTISWRFTRTISRLALKQPGNVSPAGYPGLGL